MNHNYYKSTYKCHLLYILNGGDAFAHFFNQITSGAGNFFIKVKFKSKIN